MIRRISSILALTLFGLLAACAPSSDICQDNSDCAGEQVCGSAGCVDPDWTASDRDTGPSPDAPDKPDVTELQGALKVPEKVTFQTAGKKTFTVENVGQAPVTIARIDRGDSKFFHASLASGDQELPITLAPAGDSVEFRAEFKGAYESVSTEVVIFSDALGSPHRVKLEFDIPSGGPCLKIDPQVVDFGTVKTTDQPARKTFHLTNCQESGSLTVAGLIKSGPNAGFFKDAGMGFPVTLDPGESAQSAIAYSPTQPGSHRAAFSVRIDGRADADISFDVRGEAEEPETCPRARATATIAGRSTGESLSTVPLETVQLSADKSTGRGSRTVDKYEWSLIKSPTGSTARLKPNNSVEEPRLFLDVAGTYQVGLHVVDNQGERSCQADRITIEALPQSDIYVELIWRTPMDTDETDSMGTDLDLHYLRSGGTWGQAPDDIYWQNPTADWGTRGDKTDNPSMDIDDENGAGPEAIRHNNPHSGKRYSIGVYYYDDAGMGESYATVRIYYEGMMVREFKSKKLQQTFNFWEVAEIEWPSKNIYQRDIIHSNGFPQ